MNKSRRWLIIEPAPLGLWSALAILSAAACYSPTFPEGILCSEERKCPGDQICASDDRCYDGERPDVANASLESLTFSQGVLEPAFDPQVTTYSLALGIGIQELSVTPVAIQPAGVSITVDDEQVVSGAASSPISVNFGENALEIVATSDGETKTYSVEANRGLGTAQTAYGKASNSSANDQFGTAVALDGNILVVGALNEDSSASGVGGSQSNDNLPNSGAVYVFVRTGSTWSQEAYIKASNTGGDDRFGSSVAISGDTLVVGSSEERSNDTGVNGDEQNNAAPLSGAAYVFVRIGSTWTQEAYLKASNTDAGDQFGSAVSISGDTIVVGAGGEDSVASGVNSDQEDDSAPSSGAVYVFTRNGSAWAQQAYLKASNASNGDGFGVSVFVNQDTIVVGSRGEDSASRIVDEGQDDESASGAGAAYVFFRTGGSWSQQSYLKASNSEADDSFGSKVALFGDLIAVSARGEDSALVGGQQNNSAPFAGAVYVFRRVSGIWQQEAYLKPSNPDASDGFGEGIHVYENAILVGAPGEASLADGLNGNESDNSGPSAGAAYLFVNSDENWNQVAYVKSSNPDGGAVGSADGFGGAVAIGENAICIGAGGESSAGTGLGADQNDNTAQNAGAMYVFE